MPRANGTPQNSAPSPRHEDDEYKNETLFFERNRIKQLQDERVHIQKKTFTKWCNSFLNRVRLFESLMAKNMKLRNEYCKITEFE